MSPVKHVVHTSWCAHNYVRGLSLKLLYFITKICAADTGMAGCPHVVPQSQNYLLNLLGGEMGTKTMAHYGVLQVEKQDI